MGLFSGILRGSSSGDRCKDCGKVGEYPDIIDGYCGDCHEGGTAYCCGNSYEEGESVCASCGESL